MNVTSKFIIVKHEAKRAGLHYDLRFQMPNSQNWASFAVRKGVPTEPGKKVLAVRTHDHSTKEALMLGIIKDGYGAGKLTKWDDGQCIIHKYGMGHIAVELKGRKAKGLYHLISTGVMNKKDFKSKQYMLFKGKITNEAEVVGKYSDAVGMASRLMPGASQDVEVDDEQADAQQKKPLKWAYRRSKI